MQGPFFFLEHSQQKCAAVLREVNALKQMLRAFRLLQTKYEAL